MTFYDIILQFASEFVIMKLIFTKSNVSFANSITQYMDSKSRRVHKNYVKMRMMNFVIDVLLLLVFLYQIMKI